MHLTLLVHNTLSRRVECNNIILDVFTSYLETTLVYRYGFYDGGLTSLSSDLAADTVVHDVAGQMVFPTPEQVPRELPQLSELTVRSSLGGLQLLRLY